jgi:hypothetical protein
MGKYQPLEAFLSGCEADETTMSFEEIEAVIGADLPEAAHTHRAWWSNNPSNNVMTRCWLAAGYRTERVDMAAAVSRIGLASKTTPPRLCLNGFGNPSLERSASRMASTSSIQSAIRGAQSCEAYPTGHLCGRLAGQSFLSARRCPAGA